MKYVGYIFAILLGVGIGYGVSQYRVLPKEKERKELEEKLEKIRDIACEPTPSIHKAHETAMAEHIR